MFSKPATGTYSASLISTILCGVPVHAEEHLVHGWDAIRAALAASQADDRAKVDANLRFARLRLEHATAASARVKFAKREAVRAECIELARAIDDAVRFF